MNNKITSFLQSLDLNLCLLVAIILTHCMYFLIFYFFGIYEMVYFNIYSIVNYIIAIYLYNKGNSDIVFILTYIEIFFHQLFGIIYVGYDSGFSIVLMCLFFLQCSFFSSWLFKSISSIFLIIFVCCSYYFKGDFVGLYQSKQEIIFCINIFVSSVYMVVYGTLASVTNNKNMSDLVRLIYKDFLTGLYNRKYFEEKIIPSIDGKNNVLIAICDIDNFKNINDTYGHDIGDLVLKMISSTILYEVSEKNGVVARWGGEEFILKIDVKDDKEAYKYMENVKNSVSKQKISKHNIVSTITIGGLFIKKPNKNKFLSYFKIMDKELYHGKRSGKNIVNIQAI